MTLHRLTSFLLLGSLLVQGDSPGGEASTAPRNKLKYSIERHLGRPYVWGGSGLKTFDCSGFVWRVMFDNGIWVKRTTARKLYVSLPRTGRGQEWQLGTVVFFDNFKHCGIVNDATSFYHAQVSKGTNLSRLNSFWRRQICGFRAMPLN